MAGRRETLVTFLRAPLVDDGFASRKDAFAFLHQSWASRTDVSDAERAVAGQVAGEMVSRFVVLWSAQNSDVTHSDRLRISAGGQVTEYEITGIKHLGWRDRIEVTAKTKSSS